MGKSVVTMRPLVTFVRRYLGHVQSRCGAVRHSFEQTIATVRGHELDVPPTSCGLRRFAFGRVQQLFDGKVPAGVVSSAFSRHG